MWWIWLIVVGAMVAVAAAVVVVIVEKNKGKVDDDNEAFAEQQKEYEYQLMVQIKQFKELYSQSLTQIEQLKGELQEAKNTATRYSVEVERQKVQIGVANEEGVKKDAAVAELKEKLEQAQNDTKTLETELREKLEQSQAEIKALEVEKATWVGGAQGRQYEEEELQSRIEDLKRAIEELKERNRIALGGDEEDKVFRFRFTLSEKEKKVCSLLREVGELYPGLASDLAKIEWNKVWMPQIQKVRDQIGCRGIYRLVKIGEESVCYVGQAQNIKERWYQHCKKMIGVETPGNEWLYRLRPDELEWTILEEVEDKGVKLDEVERYWIDFYKANEKGLNRI